MPKGIGEGILQKQPFAGIHDQQELVEVYLPRLVLIDPREDVLHLLLVLPSEVRTVQSHQLTHGNGPVLIRIQLTEDHC